VAKAEGDELGLEALLGEGDLRGGRGTLACRASWEDCVRFSTCFREEVRSTLKRSEDSPVLASMVTDPRSMETQAERPRRTRRRMATVGRLLIYVVDNNYG
jgi:hypothetical protein